MSNFVDISAALVTLVSGITDIENVYNFEASAVDGYPSALIFATGNDAELTSTNSNTRTFNFTVRIITQIEHDGESEAERILREVVDQVITAIDNDFSLGGVVHLVQAVPSSWGRDDREAGIIRFADVLVSAMHQVDLT